MNAPGFKGPNCPLPLNDADTIRLGHGSGGVMMQRLLQEVFLDVFSNEALDAGTDAATLALPGARIAFTTDSYVVQPMFFPGGDIGSLAVHGTVNDLAMVGARPIALSAAYILEEGLPRETLERVAGSMQRAAQACGVPIVTGDTKVVDHGKGDGIYINTAGIGIVPEGLVLGPSFIRPGDAIVINGDLGRHGIAVMAQREGLSFETVIESDSAPIYGQVRTLLEAGVAVHCLRDLTRGGLASAANELAQASGCGIRLRESAIPIDEAVRSACELLGFDPLCVANEGRFLAFVAQEDVTRALEAIGRGGGHEPACIGSVTKDNAGLVIQDNDFGTSRIVDMLAGEQLPRIC